MARRGSWYCSAAAVVEGAPLAEDGNRAAAVRGFARAANGGSVMERGEVLMRARKLFKKTPLAHEP